MILAAKVAFHIAHEREFKTTEDCSAFFNDAYAHIKQEKVANAAEATPEEMATVGHYLMPEDLESLQKILHVLVTLFQQYQEEAMQMEQGGMMPEPEDEQSLPPFQFQ